MGSVKQQYEQFPYPPIPFFALPIRQQGKTLRYETGQGFLSQSETGHAGIRILIVGCGTLEPVLVSQLHPEAEEIVAIDISQRSIDILKKRYQLAKLRDWSHLRFGRRSMASLTMMVGDLFEYDQAGFDYILASNVLHHLSDPAHALCHLSSLLKPSGLIRLNVYPKWSRYWIRQVADWLRLHGVNAQDKNLEKKARHVVNLLPEGHPVRNTYYAHSEIKTAAGVVDAFLHACENPLRMLQWYRASWDAGLQLVGESQHEYSQSHFLDELLPATAKLDRWVKLEILDAAWELCTNPILWLHKRESENQFERYVGAEPVYERNPSVVDKMPSEVYAQLRFQSEFVNKLLTGTGENFTTLHEKLSKEVGQRLSKNSEKILEGLSVVDYSLVDIESAKPAWDVDFIRGFTGMMYKNQGIPVDSIEDKARWLQIRFGSECKDIGPIQLNK